MKNGKKILTAGLISLSAGLILTGCKNDQKPVNKQQVNHLNQQINSNSQVFSNSLQPKIQYVHNYQQFDNIKLMNAQQTGGDKIKNVYHIMGKTEDLKEPIQLVNNQKGQEYLFKFDSQKQKPHELPFIYVVEYQNRILAKGFNSNRLTNPLNTTTKSSIKKGMSYTQLIKVAGRPSGAQYTPTSKTLNYILNDKGSKTLNVTLINDKVNSIK